MFHWEELFLLLQVINIKLLFLYIHSHELMEQENGLKSQKHPGIKQKEKKNIKYETFLILVYHFYGTIKKML